MARKYRRIRRIVVATLVVLLLGLAGWVFFGNRHLPPWGHLSLVIQIERSGIDETTIQPLGWSLAILGREHEVREMDFLPQFKLPPSSVRADQMEFTVVPWRDGIEQIAADNRVVMIMENHMVPKHREFIGETLSLFREAGFSHYAAEAIHETGAALTERGYPTSQTGVYTADPRFGNELRRALRLRFEMIGYDHPGPSTHDEREKFAAEQLAKVLRDPACTGLLVHAGHAHVLKQETESGQRWLAARLWELTEIEPFTIWQWSSGYHDRDYAEIAQELQSRGLLADEPVLLMPPPSGGFGFRDAPYESDGSPRVDAIVIHPPGRSTSPSDREVLFPRNMQRVSGRWTQKLWPVVVCAYNRGEPANAIPLDQIMLRENESEFLLWVPKEADYIIRVVNSDGFFKTNVTPARDGVVIDVVP